MKIAVCPGSFDPVTNGHMDIIRRASKMFDKVIVVVLTNFAKKANFTVEKRVELLEKAVQCFDNVEVDHFNGLLADYAKIRDAKFIIKGLRAVSDFEYEFQMAMTNSKLNPELETVFLTSNSNYMYLSSSIVRQVAQLGGDIHGFVPECIREEIIKKYSQGGIKSDS